MTRLTRNGDPRAAQTLKAQLRLRQMILDGELRAGERVPELMLVERTGYSRFGEPVEFARDLHRADRTRFVVDINLPAI